MHHKIYYNKNKNVIFLTSPEKRKEPYLYTKQNILNLLPEEAQWAADFLDDDKSYYYEEI